MKEWSDEELIRQIKEGDVLAYEILVKRYQHRLFAFVERIVSEKMPAEDMVLEALFKIYKNIEKIDPSRKFSTYLFEIAKNEAISYLRSHKKEISIHELEIIDEDESVYERLSRDNEADKIRKAVSLLEEKYRQAVMLYYFEDLSYNEIASKSKLPVNTVRTHLRRAKEQLKKILKQL